MIECFLKQHSKAFWIPGTWWNIKVQNVALFSTHLAPALLCQSKINQTCGCKLKGEFVGEEMGWITAISTASRGVYLIVHLCENLTLRFCSVLFHPWIIHISSHLINSPHFTHKTIIDWEIETFRCTIFMAISNIKNFWAVTVVQPCLFLHCIFLHALFCCLEHTDFLLHCYFFPKISELILLTVKSLKHKSGY